MTRPVLIMAGGTGGHVFPALAVASALRQQGLPVEWLATRRGMEQQLLTHYDFPRHTIGVSGLRGHGIGAWLFAPLKLIAALAACIRVFIRRRPCVAVGMGGFASGPGGIAARLLGVPLVIHEQNAIAGSTNRILARLATLILQAFPGTFAESRRPITTGNPVRPTIEQVRSRSAGEKLAPEAGTAVSERESLRVLVLGGSQGARFLNEQMPQALATVRTWPLEIRHQSGAVEKADTEARYRSFNLKADVSAFIDDMAAAYAWADLAICRAGALTIAELATTGTPALLIPFPYATDQHQHANAATLVQAGAALTLDQSAASLPNLTTVLDKLTDDRTRLQQMAAQALACSHAGATAKVVQAIMRVRHGQ